MPLTITVPDMWDENTSEFLSFGDNTLVLEHSLNSLHEWEKRWKVPFLTDKEKTLEQLQDYIRCMTLNHPDPKIYKYLPMSVYNKIKTYIEDPMTATTIHDRSPNNSREIITAEVVYANMVAFNIPFECASWHLNTLITLIRVCAIKNGNGSEKKMTSAEAGAYQRALNEKRLAAQRAKKR